ncbi:MAG: WD40 repeat domain-containing protein [Aggregatilineales bacterium]
MRIKITIIFLLLFLNTGIIIAQSDIFQESDGTVITLDTIDALDTLARYGRGSANSLTWSPDGTTLAVTGGAGIWLYTIDDFSADITPLTAHNSSVLSLAYHPDNDTFISGAADNTIWEWSVAGDAARSFTVPYSAAFLQIVYTNDGSQFIGATGTDILLWNTESGQQVSNLSAHTAPISALAINSDDIMASASENGEFFLWDISSGEQINDISTESTSIVALTWIDDDQLLSASSGGVIQIYDTNNDAPITNFSNDDGSVTALTWDSSRERIIIGTNRNSITLYTLDDDDIDDTPETLDTGADVLAMALSPDDAVLAVLTVDMALQLWAMDDLESLETLTDFHSMAAINAEFNPNGTQLVVVYEDKLLLQYDLETGSILSALETASPALRPVITFNDDGSVFALMDDFGVTLQNADDGSQRAYLDARNLISTFAWSPDSSLVITGDRGGNLEIWDADTGNLLRAFTDHKATINSISFSSDGSLLVSAASDGTVRLYGIPE